MKQSKVVIVVPLYINHESLYPVVERFFDSLKENYLDVPLFVVDDASPLPHDFLCAVRSHDNHGFTHTVNTGLKVAFHQEADIVLVLNDDLVIQKGDLDRFFDLDPAKPVIASPRDTSSDDTDKWGAIWGITRAAYDLLGPMDERYKHFFSDVDYYDRAKEKGVEIIKWQDIVVEHPESATYKHTDKDKFLFADAETYMENHPDGNNRFIGS